MAKKTLPFNRMKPFSTTTDPPADGWLGNRGGVKRASREGQKEAVDIFQGCTACVAACSLGMCVSPSEQQFLDSSVSVAADKCGKCVAAVAALTSNRLLNPLSRTSEPVTR